MIYTVSFTLGAWTLRMEEGLVWGPCWSETCMKRQFSWWWKITSTMSGPLKNVSFVPSCLQNSSGEGLNRAQKATGAPHIPFTKHQLRPSQTLLWRYSRGVIAAGTRSYCSSTATTWELGTEQGGIHLLGTGKSATATFEFISKSTFVLSMEQLI